MLLENKNAVIYGAGGGIGGAVVRAFAREGAKLFLAGRILAKVEAVAHMAADLASARSATVAIMTCGSVVDKPAGAEEHS